MSSFKGPKPPGRFDRITLGVKHAIKHKGFVKFDEVDTEDDKSYAAAAEQFLEFQTQLGMVIHHTTSFRRTLEDSLQQAVELADDFGRISSGQGGNRGSEPWAVAAGRQAFGLKGMLEESVEALRQHLNVELDEKVMRSLEEEQTKFNEVQQKMRERYNMKVEMLHYSYKMQELSENQKATDEKKDRNKEKYALAAQNMRDQTDQLMSVFAHAEQVRQKILTRDLPLVIECKQRSFDLFSAHLSKATGHTSGAQQRSPTSPYLAQRSGAEFRSASPSHGLAEVSLADDSASGPETSLTSPFPVNLTPPAPAEVMPTVVKKRSPTPLSPAKTGSPRTPTTNGGGEFGMLLREAQHHQKTKMDAASGKRTDSGGHSQPTPEENEEPTPLPLYSEMASERGISDEGFTSTDGPRSQHSSAGGHSSSENRRRGSSTEGGRRSSENSRYGRESFSLDEERKHVSASSVKQDTSLPLEDSMPASAAVGDINEELEELPPGKMRVRALYDYEATQDGDLSFSAGDIIVTDGGAFSGDGWVSGTCRGKSGIFPGNYTEPY